MRENIRRYNVISPLFSHVYNELWRIYEKSKGNENEALHK